jgi:hypothetical protein
MAEWAGDAVVRWEDGYLLGPCRVSAYVCEDAGGYTTLRVGSGCETKLHETHKTLASAKKSGRRMVVRLVREIVANALLEASEAAEWLQVNG